MKSPHSCLHRHCLRSCNAMSHNSKCTAGGNTHGCIRWCTCAIALIRWLEILYIDRQAYFILTWNITKKNENMPLWQPATSWPPRLHCGCKCKVHFYHLMMLASYYSYRWCENINESISPELLLTSSWVAINISGSMLSSHINSTIFMSSLSAAMWRQVMPACGIFKFISYWFETSSIQGWYTFRL